jgi:hypothetical protein
MSKTTRTVLLVVGIVLVAFGFLAILSIGIFFLVPGIAVLIVASGGSTPIRLAILAGAVAFVGGWILIGPHSCTESLQQITSNGGAEATSSIVCRGPLFTWHSDPGLWLALLGGSVAAAGAAWIVLRLTRRRESAPAAAPTP